MPVRLGHGGHSDELTTEFLLGLRKRTQDKMAREGRRLWKTVEVLELGGLKDT